MNSKSLYGVVLAGGSGTRFWPRSRQSSPKQLCKITDTKLTMLEQTLHRLDGWIPPEQRMIVTHHSQKKKTQDIAQALSHYILAEPFAKNTTAALVLALFQIKLIDSDDNAVMISLHSDHLVKDTQAFQKTLQEAVSLAKEGYLSLVGMQPRSPETGFGYIQRGERLNINGVRNAFKVQSFKEKPNKELAQKYVNEKQYEWNTGIFVWQIKTLSEELKTYVPEIWNPLFKIYNELKAEHKTFDDLDFKTLQDIYAKLPEIAIDHAILEKSSKCALVSANFDWNDVGTWTALSEVLTADKNGNITQGTEHLLLETKDCIVASDGPFVATYGVENLIVVVENGCVLVCPKDKAQGIKDIVGNLKKSGREDLI